MFCAIFNFQTRSSMYPWGEMEYQLENTIRKDMDKGNGGRDLELDDVIALIANSIA